MEVIKKKFNEKLIIRILNHVSVFFLKKSQRRVSSEKSASDVTEKYLKVIIISLLLFKMTL